MPKSNGTHNPLLLNPLRSLLHSFFHATAADHALSDLQFLQKPKQIDALSVLGMSATCRRSPENRCNRQAQRDRERLQTVPD